MYGRDELMGALGGSGGFRVYACDIVGSEDIFVSTGFTYDIGEEIEIVASRDDVGWYLTDCSRTFREMVSAGFSMTPYRRSMMLAVTEVNNAVLWGTEIRVPLVEGSELLGVRSMVQAVLQMQALVHVSGTAVRGMFVDDVLERIRSEIPDCEFGRVLVNDLGEECHVDAYIGGDSPLLVFAVGSRSKCTNVLLSLMALSDDSHRVLAVIDDSARIPKSNLRMLENRSDCLVHGIDGVSEALRGMTAGEE